MRIQIKTEVRSDWKKVESLFNEDLFLKLNPPFPKVRLNRFDGCQKGDIVEMELNFILWKDRWRSDITSNSSNEDGFDFVDEGTKLPFPFKYWRHHHKVEKSENGSLIIDDISYKSLNSVLSLVLYPLLYLQFLYRKPVYKKTFSEV